MRKIKIYKTFHAYSSYLDNLYGRYPLLKFENYNTQKNALIYDGMPWIFSWSTNNTLENIEIFETVHNCEWLQKAWSPDTKFDKYWQIEIVLKQIQKFKPDICVLYPPEFFNQEAIERIKNILNYPVLIIGYDGMDRKNIELYASYDIVITCSGYISRFYKENNKETYTLPFCFDESILNRLTEKSKYKYNVGFSGSIFPNVHNGRYEFLRELTNKIKVEIRSDFSSNLDLRLFSKYQLKRLIREHDLKNYFALRRIDRSNKGVVFGLNMYQFLKDSKISINMHGDNINFAANVRLFEITGVGSCMLTDWKENIEELFEPDKEIVTYKTVDEAIDKVRFLLKDESARRRIAHAGQQRTLNEYTYKKTISELLLFLQNQI